MNGESQKRLICIGFQRWKHPQLAPILSVQPRRAIFVPDAAAARRLNPGPDDMLVWWSCDPPPGAIELARESDAGVLRMEDGFIRSVGLGSDLIPPLSLVLDQRGIFFDPRQISDLEHILLTEKFSPDELERARNLRSYIVRHGLTKYNLEPRIRAEWPSQGREVILVPGQVEDDASIRFGCSDVRTNAGLLKAAREANPAAFIVYKPHPDVMSGNRRGRLALREARTWADHIETDLSVTSCIDACDALHTMTSLAGFDALLRGKRVVTYGQPFYAGWGLTEDRDAHDTALVRRSGRVLTLDELVAGALLRYPLYWDAQARAYTDCETVLRRIVATRDALERSGGLEKLRSGYARRQRRKAIAWLRALLLRV
tara:strand:- start:89636 stop:90751 length:1116 start_codon:yes stop_codon:yes gene_type:complete